MTSYDTKYFLFEDTGHSSKQNDNSNGKQIVFTAYPYDDKNNLLGALNYTIGGIIEDENVYLLKIPSQNVYYRTHDDENDFDDNWLLYHVEAMIIKKYETEEKYDEGPPFVELAWTQIEKVLMGQNNPFEYEPSNYSMSNYRQFKRPTIDLISNMKANVVGKTPINESTKF